MTTQEIFNAERTPEEVISILKNKTVAVPAWGKLENEYYASKHPVMTDPTYQDRIRKGKTEHVTRITLGWQKLAAKRMAELMFGTPVKRIYDPKNDAEKQAAQLMEAIYQKNKIDSLNLDRAKKLFAACECVTIWYAQDVPTKYADETSELKLRCRTFSPMEGAKLYPLFDEYDDLIALSVEHRRTDLVDGKSIDVTYFDTYTADEHICWKSTTGKPQEEIRESINIGKISGVYIHRPEPVWEDLSGNVYEAEWTYSRNGNYIRKNSRPTFVIYTDNGVKKGLENTDDNAGRSIIRLGQNDKAEYATWQQANESIKFHVQEIKHNFFSQLQLPDMSMDNMKETPMSGESRKMLFIDSQMKVTDEGGIWYDMLYREFNVIREYAKLMFPNYAAAFEALSVKMQIVPFTIHDERERVETLGAAVTTNIASRKTAIARLGWVDDVDAEVQQINDEQTSDLFDEPTV
jgi:hypothetical protein